MKKEKSNVVVSISIILVSLFLAINLVIDNYEMKCNREIERLMIYNKLKRNILDSFQSF